MSTIKDYTFAGLSKLEQLLFNFGRVQYIEPFAFYGLDSLQYFIINDNSRVRTGDLGSFLGSYGEYLILIYMEHIYHTVHNPKVIHYFFDYFWTHFGVTNFGIISFLHYFTVLPIIVTPFVLFFSIFYLFYIISYFKIFHKKKCNGLEK